MQVIKILEESGSIAYLEETLDKFENRLHQMIDSIDDKLGDNRKRGVHEETHFLPFLEDN